MSYFTELGLAEPILRALGTKGYSDPTPIQRQAIPALLEGRDLLGIAQTGTGKTAAFSLPSIHRLAADPQPRKPAACRMLVLSPTRELAAQIADNMRAYAKYLTLNVQCVFGGMPLGKQARALVPGCDILVATPGRLLDLIDQRALTLRHVEIFVLDEADQMMDLGFIHALKRLAAMLPKERQSLFFSATMPKAIADLGKQFINDPVRVEVTPQASTAERVEQYATFLNQSEKQALLTLKLRTGLADGTIDRALVFSRTKHGADRVVRHLLTAGIEAAAIHGNKSQGQRTAAIKDFKSGTVRVLIATDIAARGIDIPGVSHVLNYELPNVAEQYVHRIGRTARNGADGIALSFVAPDERAYLRDIEKLTRVKLEVMPLPADFIKEAARLPLPARVAADDRREGDRGRMAQPRGRGDGPGDGRRARQSEARQDNTPRPRATHKPEPTEQARRHGTQRPVAAHRPDAAEPARRHDGARPVAPGAPAERNYRPRTERSGADGHDRARTDRPERAGPAASHGRPERHEARAERPHRARTEPGADARPARPHKAATTQDGAAPRRDARPARPGGPNGRPSNGRRPGNAWGSADRG
jgi:ATP-dependent RNA helicase RhlE